MNVDLKNIRAEIDRMDDALLSTFLKRLEVANEIAVAKRDSGGSISDPSREKEILKRIYSQVGEKNRNAAKLFFSTLFSYSKARQWEIIKPTSPVAEVLKSMPRNVKKISIVFTLLNKPGALACVIAKFAAIGVNLTKIESKQIEGERDAYRFVCEFEASPQDAAVQSLLTEFTADDDVVDFNVTEAEDGI